MTRLDPTQAEGHAALEAVLVRGGAFRVAVERVIPLSGGASSATYAVDAVRGGAPWPLILQCAALEAGTLARSTQAALQMRAGARGVAVAPVVAVLAPDDRLGDGFVMERIEGESLAPRWLRLPEYAAAREAMTAQCAAALARLHAIPIAEVADLELAPSSPAASREALYQGYRSYGVDVPVFDLAFAWCAERLPDEPASAVVHGDFRSGNFIVGPEGLRAVLDWELAHLGHPLMDLAWLCCGTWRFGQWRLPVGGFGRREELIAAYEAAGGRRVDRPLLAALELFASLRWGVMCLQMAHAHLSGALPSVERAAIGRRVSETEADILHILKHGEV
jgi:aminoglycoside phosphotransferase (APT) family kinase protein